MDVNRLLIDYDERATAATRKALAACQRARKMDGRLDPDFAARALTTFIMRLNHMDTLHPHLIGDKRWREFIAERVAVMLGLQSPTRKRRHPRGAEYRVPTIDALLLAYHRLLARPGPSTERTLRRCTFPFRRELGRPPSIGHNLPP